MPTANSHRGLSGIILRNVFCVYLIPVGFQRKITHITTAHLPPVREEKQRRQRDGQLELPPVPDEIRNESHAHVSQIERDVMQRADHGPPLSAHYFHGCNLSKSCVYNAFMYIFVVLRCTFQTNKDLRPNRSPAVIVFDILRVHYCDSHQNNYCLHAAGNNFEDYNSPTLIYQTKNKLQYNLFAML